jgi:ComF family protein
MLNAIHPANFFALFFPKLCASCQKDLRTSETVLCTSCIIRLPKLDQLDLGENTMERLFYGKVEIAAAAGYFRFQKGGRIQHLAHLLKYEGRQDVGDFTGRLIGQSLLSSNRFKEVQQVIPVPLHPSRLRKRGYNQAACISAGISAVTGWQHFPNGLHRVRASDTQTLKQRYARFENVDGIFRVNDPDQHYDKQILLVDDVVTTGSTMVACAEALVKIPGVKVFPLSMAVAG